MLASGGQRELWQKDEGQVGGGSSGEGQRGDGLMVEGQVRQDRSGFESYLAWASPTWQAHSGFKINLIWDSCKTDSVVPFKLSLGPEPSSWTESNNILQHFLQ